LGNGSSGVGESGEGATALHDLQLDLVVDEDQRLLHRLDAELLETYNDWVLNLCLNAELLETYNDWLLNLTDWVKPKHPYQTTPPSNFFLQFK